MGFKWQKLIAPAILDPGLAKINDPLNLDPFAAPLRRMFGTEDETDNAGNPRGGLGFKKGGMVPKAGRGDGCCVRGKTKSRGSR